MCIGAIGTMDNSDKISHLDSIGRYEPYPINDMLEHVNTIDKILKALTLKNKKLEINPSSYLSQNLHYPSQDIFKCYHHLSGCKLLIGSNIHPVDAITQFYWRLKQD
jgi:histidinol phosphatase-like PHP family hydrolase